MSVQLKISSKIISVIILFKNILSLTLSHKMGFDVMVEDRAELYSSCSETPDKRERGLSLLKVFKSTCTHHTQLFNTSLRHFPPETIEFLFLSARTPWQGSVRRFSRKQRQVSTVITLKYYYYACNVLLLLLLLLYTENSNQV